MVEVRVWQYGWSQEQDAINVFSEAWHNDPSGVFHAPVPHNCRRSLSASFLAASSFGSSSSHSEDLRETLRLKIVVPTFLQSC